MKRYILNITTLITALILSANFAWGQTTISGTWAGGSLSGSYKLTGNTTLTGSISVASGKTLTVDLNGYLLRGGNITTMFEVDGGEKLIIKDSSNREREHIGSLNSLGLWYPNNNGNITLYGGTICPTYTDTSTKRIGISISGSCVIEYANIVGFYSTTIGAAVTATSSGQFTMNGGQVSYNYTKNSSDRAGAIYGEPTNKNSGSSINISNTTLSYNKSEGLGGAICGFNITLKNSKVLYNESTTNGGGLVVRGANSALSLSDNCEIAYNKSGKHGGGIYVSEECTNIHINIADSKINYNEALGASSVGGGVAINTANSEALISTCNINNSEINYNYCEAYGGGIYSKVSTTVSNSKINYNRAMATVSPDSKQLGRGAGFEFTGASINELNDNTEVAYNAAMMYGGGGQIDSGAKLTIKGNSKIHNNTVVLHGAGGVHLTSQAHLVLEDGEISNNECYTVGGAIHTSYGCVVELNGGEINNNFANQRGGGVHINTGGDLVLNGTTFSGNSVARGYDMVYAEVYKDSNGIRQWRNLVPNMNSDNTNIDSDGYYKNTGYGGAILIDSGTLTMNEGEISNNTAEIGGGGIALVMIRLSDKASDFSYLKVVSFTMNDGMISGNNCSNGSGAGVYIMKNKIPEYLKNITPNNLEEIKKLENYNALYNGIPFSTIKQGSLLSNTASTNGGAIYMEQGNFSVNGDITMNENQAGANGGALYLGGGDVNALSGVATIQSNTANGNGGAIYVGSGSVTLQEATISGNTSGNGGAIYAKGNVTINDEATINTNTATGNGGAIYVEGGNLTTKKVTASGNKAVNGGVFFVKGGNVNLGVTVSGQTITQVAAAEMTSNTASGNGGAIALENGVFTMHNGSMINSNSADGYGGGLYIKNTSATSITCKGGTFSQNKAKAGGAVCADGPITLALAANIENNTAQVGGGIYMVNGVNMTFGDASQPLGLIRANKAQGTTTLGTAKGKNAETVSGVGGGIFMADGTGSNKTTLKFANPKELGIYNNSASFAGADICANGNNTLITLPKTSEMNLTGFDVPGNMLYWAEDFANRDTGYTEGTGIRYVDELRAQSPNVKHFSADRTHDVDKYACLDLGYDLVFVKIKNTGLQLNDDCAVTISYDKVQTDANGEVIKDGNGNPTYVLTEYRKILFSGKGTANDNDDSVYDTEIGLPSNDSWKFKVTQWSYKYDGVEFSPGEQKRLNNALETVPDAIYGISKEGIKWNNGNDSDRLITIKHILKKDGSGNDINIGDFNTRVVNKMIPGGSSSN